MERKKIGSLTKGDLISFDRDKYHVYKFGSYVEGHAILTLVEFNGERVKVSTSDKKVNIIKEL